VLGLVSDRLTITALFCAAVVEIVGAAGGVPPVNVLPPPPLPLPQAHINAHATAQIKAPNRRTAARIGPPSRENQRGSRSSLFNPPQVAESNPNSAASCVLSYAVEKAMSNAKQQVESLLQNLPENCSLEDIQYHLYVLEKIRRGLHEAQQGAVTQADAEKHLSKWLVE
jgi:hypothetical protein